MAYIIVTTDIGEMVFKKHHTQYPVEKGQESQGIARLHNDLASAVLQAEMQAAIGGGVSGDTKEVQ